MSNIFLEQPLNEHNLASLREEFPQYEFLSLPEEDPSAIPWDSIEIIYGQLSEEELSQAKELRWVHTTTPFFDTIHMKTIKQHSNHVIVSDTRGNIYQIGEFVIANILAFAKNLFLWKDNNPEAISSMWTLKNRTLLQVGMGILGKEITRRAHQLNLKVWGISSTRLVHPHCHKTFVFDNLNSLLPSADIVSICLPSQKQSKAIFQHAELSLTKKDSIIVILGSRQTVDENDLYEVASQGHFRGVIIDTFEHNAISPTSPLRELPNVLITTEVAKLPIIDEHLSFKTFRYNLRQFANGNYEHMKNAFFT